MKKVWLIIIAVGIAVTAVAWLLMRRGSPEYALSQIQSAIEDRNRLRFQAYVDLDRALPTTVDQLLANHVFSASERSGAEALGAMIGSALVDQMKPALVQTLRSSILESVESGAFDSLFAGSVSEVDLADIERASGADPNQFAGLTGVVKEGDDALVGLRFSHPQLDTTLVLQLRMERVDGTWMIVGPEDLGRYMGRVEEFRAARLAEINELATGDTEDHVRIGEFQTDVDRLMGFSMVELSQTVENVGDRSIWISFGRISAPNDESLDGTLFVPSQARLEPGESTMLSRTFSDIGGSEIPQAVLDGGPLNATLQLGMVVGNGEDAEYLGPYSSWEELQRGLADPSEFAQALLRTSVDAGDADPLSAAVARAEAGPWVTNESTNPLDDSPIVTLMTQAMSGRSAFGRAPTLVLRCRDNTTEVYVNWSEYLGSDTSIPVAFRVGDGTMERSRWGMSTDNQATFFPGSHIGIIRRMLELDADRFVAQVTPYNESPTTAEFDLTGLEEEIAPLQAACGWS